MHVAWLAYSAKSIRIQNGSFFFRQHRSILEDRVDFDEEFERTPRVFLALSGFDLPAKKKLRIGVEISRLDKKGFSWKGLTLTTDSSDLVWAQWIAFG